MALYLIETPHTVYLVRAANGNHAQELAGEGSVKRVHEVGDHAVLAEFSLEPEPAPYHPENDED